MASENLGTNLRFFENSQVRKPGADRLARMARRRLVTQSRGAAVLLA